MEWQTNLVDDDTGLARILRETRSIAVLGAKGEASQPAFYVPAYLKTRGYRVLPVNPTRVGERIFGESVVATLADLHETPDVVEVFRRPQFLQAHAAEIVRLAWKPAVVWFQLGIRNDTAAETLARAGIRVVQDRCMMPEHRRLLGAA
jgi:hypothetical protein